ncbi:sensor histidine kinase [Paenibacillus protaetiae]|uniref:sensor histidine kinase n=1 Tax=Paenibacillus protaetiae TaxID=2509456 RepID=UPI00244BDA57|nr:Spo0B domain-containing protein [Paenibacillus protaetiae]
MQRNSWLVAISVIVIVILLNNIAYYFLTKHSLEESLEQEMTSVAKQIEISLELSRLGSAEYEDQIGRELRADSIAAQYALDPDVEKVTNKQLSELSSKLGIDHITLMKRTGDDIIFYKSSDPNEIGHGTKSMAPWFTIFNQLFDEKAVSVNWLGQTLPFFWTGPYETATTDIDHIYKWGYYYDGTTNYIIDPYVGYKRLKDYEDKTGVSRIIEQTIEQNDSLLEVSVINPKTFDKGSFDTITSDGKTLEHIVQKPIVYGSYNYRFDDDAQNILKAYHTGQTVRVDKKKDGEQLFKMFIPVSIDGKQLNMVDDQGQQLDGYVLSLVSDKHVIQNKLDKQFMSLGLIIIAVTGLSIVIAVFFMRYYRLSQDKAVQVTQMTYADEINQMFQAIRGQRHDFLNHVQTIYALAELRKSEELLAYAKELTGEIRAMNDIINIGNPAIAALIRSKLSQAEAFHIQLDCKLGGLTKLGMGIRTLDLNRMIGNLIDNAFDEVLKFPEEQRLITLASNQEDGWLEIRISNICMQADQVAGQPIFNPGYSTKQGGTKVWGCLS